MTNTYKDIVFKFVCLFVFALEMEKKYGSPPPYKNAGVTVFNVSVKQTTWLCPKPMKVGFDLKSLTGIPRIILLRLCFVVLGTFHILQLSMELLTTEFAATNRTYNCEISLFFINEFGYDFVNNCKIKKIALDWFSCMDFAKAN